MLVSAPYLLFLGDAKDHLAVKTAQGVLDWRPEWCLAQLRLDACQVRLDLPDMTIEQARAQGARTLVIGVVNSGGTFPPAWEATVVAALEAGMDVASGMHTRLGSIEPIRQAAERTGGRLIDLRHSTERFGTGKGIKRGGKRLLTVGTDCSVGKKYTALALEKEMRARGLDADFRATGQTGVLISGRGVAIDAVVADFISGAVEWVSPEAPEDHWDLIEGQGSLFHPAFAGVSLGLLHGAQADAFVVCHEPTRRTMRGVPAELPSIGDVIEQTVRLGSLTNRQIRAAGLSVNTSALDEAEARRMLQALEDEHGLPATDPIRHGVATIVDHLEAMFGPSADTGR